MDAYTAAHVHFFSRGHRTPRVGLGHHRRLGVQTPLLLACLRFAFLAVPAVFLVNRPRAPWRLVAAYGVFLGVGEFGLLFTAMKLGAPAGLSSLILQSQAFFTALLAARFLGEPFALRSAIGMVISASGLAVIGWRGSQPGAWGGHFALALFMLIAAGFM
jgi:O-acetylserine/cysteine efflux transporter